MTEYIIQAADWAIDKNGDSLFKGCEEIVRCKDCKYYDTHTDPSICYRNIPGTVVYDSNGFCAWGAREGDER